jgi:PAS domain S-box-containing protein
MTKDNKKTILLVEDEKVTARLERKILEKHGFRVIICETGEEALETVNNTPGIELVLMDIDLGEGMDGTETAVKILQDHDLPLIFISSHTEPEIVERTEGITSYGYVVKDTGETVLLAAVRMAFRLFEAKMKEQEKEKALQVSEERFRRTFEQAAVGIAHVSLDGRFLRINQRFCEITGYSREELMNLRFQDITHPDSRSKDMEKTPELAEGTIEADSTEKKYIRKDGKVIWVRLTVSMGRDSSDDEKYFISIIEDITNRKLAEQALLQSHERYRQLYQSAGIGVGYFTGAGTVIYFNGITLKYMRKEEEDVVGKSLYDLFPEEVADEYMRRIREVVENDRITQYEDKVSLPSGEKWLLSILSPVHGAGESRTGVQVMLFDISHRRRAEEKLFKSDEQKNLILNSTSEMIAYYDRELQILWCNRASADSVGKSQDELIGSHCYQVWHNRDRPCENCPVLRSRDEKKAVEAEIETPDGRYWHLRGYPVMEDDEVVAMVEYGMDITEQKTFEKELVNSEERLRTVLEDLPGAVFAHDMEGNITYANRVAAEFTGYTKEELMNMTVADLDPESVTPDDRERLWHTMKSGEPITIQSTHFRKDGSSYAAEIHLNAVVLEGRNTILPVVFDITERIKNEEQIQSLLQEKEYILREVHHRIKNNMNTMVNLLSLQADSMDDEGAELALTGAVNRMKSMMVLYDRLYRSESLSDISSRDYISSLVDDIIKTFPLEPEVNREIDDIVLPIRLASTLGIIVNELISNAMKYAFSPERKNRLSIVLRKDEDHIRLEIADNGEGIRNPEGEPGFGMELVRGLVKELNGTFHMKNRDGTCCVLEFDIQA